MLNSKKNIILIGVATVGLLGCLSGYLYLRYEAGQYNTLMRQASTLYEEQQYDGALNMAQSADSHAFTSVEHDNARYLLAEAYAGVGGSGNLKSAVDIFKQLIADKGIAPRLQGLSYAQLGWISVGQPDAGKALVFGGAPYTEDLSQFNGDVGQATALLFDKSNAAYPSVAASYESAYLKAVALSTRSKSLNRTDQLRTATVIRDQLAQGDRLLASTSLALPYRFPIYKSKAQALLMISRYLPDISQGEIDAAYELALAATDDPTFAQTPYAQGTAALFYLSYAALCLLESQV